MGRVGTLAVAGLLLGGCSGPGADPGPGPPPAVTAAELPEGDDTVVVRIVDGDTLVVRGAGRVRLIGIDTPEVHQDECYAREATRFLASLVPPGTRVRLVYDLERFDRFDRVLAYLYRVEDGAFVNAAVVAGGYGQILTIPPNVAHQETFLALQREARAEERGLWGACEESAGGAAPAGGPVAIAGTRFDAPGNDAENPNGEWVRVANRGPDPVEMGGWRLEDEGPNYVYRFPEGLVLAPGEEVRVLSGCGTDTAGELHWCVTGSAVWNNDGDVASLFDRTGRLVDRYPE